MIARSAANAIPAPCYHDRTPTNSGRLAGWPVPYRASSSFAQQSARADGTCPAPGASLVTRID
jgi:hypothetical protein